MIRLLWMAAGALLNRVRGGLFDFWRKTNCYRFLALVARDIETTVCVFVAAYGTAIRMGNSICGAWFGTALPQAEVPQIDEIVNSVR